MEQIVPQEKVQNTVQDVNYLMTSRIPVIVVSGFLGSGKTTFLKYLIENTKKKFGLLINEFGDIGIDGDLLKNSSSCSEDSCESIIELNNG